jgi:asparagine N-glycosylation enzyme membrane subunit Stt3
MFYIALFLTFLYFKIARVHKKEEKLTNLHIVTHAVVAISAFAQLAYGFSHYSWIYVFVISFIFFIAAALMVTAVQVGIFVDGKPFIKISTLHKSMPYLAGTIALFSILLYLF